MKNSYYLKNRDRLLTLAKKYNIEHQEHIKEMREKRHRKCRDIIFSILGSKCCRCGFGDFRALQVDHVFGGGSKDRRARGSNGASLLEDVIKNEHTGKYQILCANCNWIKRFENNENKKRN